MPSPETVTRALEQIAKSAANYEYFFSKLNNPDWLEPLAEHGRFKTPPSKLPVDGGFTFPGWPESQYLTRMAKIPAAQERVLRIVLAMAETDNIRVHADLMEIALALPAAESAKLVKRARAWIQTPYHNFALASYKAGDLIAHLARGGQATAALQLAKETFAITPAAPAEKAEEEWLPTPEPRTWLSDWHYDDALKKAIPALVNADGPGTFSLVCDLLDRAIVLSRGDKEPPAQDYSYIWHPAIEQDEYPPQLRNTLIATVRNVAIGMLDGAPGDLPVVLGELRRHEWPVFLRIELYLLERFRKIALDEIPRHALALGRLEGPTHEAASLLKASFNDLPSRTQEEILRIMDAGPEEDGVWRWFAFTGQEATPEALARFGDAWRAERFALLADQVPPSWRARVEEVLSRAGRVRRLDEVERGAMWMGPSSPKTREELEQLGPDGVVTFLRTWEATPGIREATPEGLGRNLEQVIANDPVPYVERAAQFETLDPTFLRFFFSGLDTALKNAKTFSWEPVLALAAWVIAQPREIAGRKRALMEADESWQWTRGAIATLLDEGLHEPRQQRTQPEIAYVARPQVWGILEPLTHDPDPTPEHEAKYGGDNMDPPTMAINTVRGKAINAVVAYALWVRRHLDRQDPRPPATLASMPEVRVVLEGHLDVQREPSLAIRSCYGQFFPWLQLLDRAWVQQALHRIFPVEQQFAAYRAAAWDAYLRFCRPYDDVLPVLEPEYLRAVQALPRAVPKNKSYAPQDSLADHIMAYYWRAKLALGSELITAFFGDAPPDLRARAIESVGRSLANRKDESPIPDEVLARLRDLWQWRLDVARGSTDPMMFQQELSRFGLWFSSQQFDPAWSLAQLRAVLDLAKLVWPEFGVAEALETLTPQFPLECIQCARLMAQSDRRGWEMYASEKHLKAIIKSAINSGNLAAKAAADSFVQYLVSRGHFDYRGLLA